MGQTFIKIACIALLFSFSSVSFARNEEPKDPKKVSVIVDELKPGFATLSWVDTEITSIRINSNNGQVIPSIPVMDTTSLHLNGLINGTYEILFLIGDKVIATENLTVNK
jgi:hypothetical protein